MNVDRFRRIKEIFQAALERDPGERSTFLEEACGGDPSIRAEVEKLLSTDEEDELFLETPATTGLPPGLSGATLAGERVGPYHVERVISSGGMGTVYEAVQRHPERTVAMKVMKEGFVTAEALRRFEFETRILARLEHPHIARVIDAGTLGDGEGTGLPYFVMEYVPNARSLTDFAEEEALTPRQRLELFLQVCDAVHYGHQKGVIHRDLKPSNILVDESCAAKIIDFGVARSTGADVALTTMHTEAGRIIGTLQYMSPEQCEADPRDLDIRSDIYTLGVVLFELLCGELPYDVSTATVFEAARRIRDEEPKRPGEVKRFLRGDLETILLKAMEKERDRRYQSMADFASDIRRHLRGETILARPASPWVKTWKRIKRNPLVSAAAGVAVVAALAALVSLPGFVSRLADETERALSAERNAAAGMKESRAQTRLANERYDEVLRLSDIKRFSELEGEADELWPAVPEMSLDMEAWMERAGTLLDRLEIHEQTLARLREKALPLEDKDRGKKIAWAFIDHEDQWEHDLLQELVEGLKASRDDKHGTINSMERRLHFARTVHEESIGKHEDEWNHTIASVADEHEGLEITPQLGLVPLGRDPESKLFEFAHLQTGAVPVRGSNGKLAMTEDSGLVFILLPGGRFPMGARRPSKKDSAGSPKVDPWSLPPEGPVHDVSIKPFFLSKFEMTQGQWERFTGENPCFLKPGMDYAGEEFTLLHPVENVSRLDCELVLSRMGLRLPTEAEWEYAARGGTTTIWWTGDEKESLAGAANLSDLTCKKLRNAEDWAYEEWLEDGRYTHAAVGSYGANAFGLHDICGNVWEWCMDAYHYSYKGAPLDGSAWTESNLDAWVFRGGSFDSTARECRSSSRVGTPKEYRAPSIGLRPALSLKE